MSSSSESISMERFALAISDLPLTNVYTKAAEIRNSMSHLIQSNEQLRPHAEQGDRDCTEAIQENVQVIGRMEERLQLLKHEVERRGYTWHEQEGEEARPPTATVVDGSDHTSDNLRHVSGQSAELVNGSRESPIPDRDVTGNPGQADALEQAAVPVDPEAASRSRDEDEGGLHL